METEDSEERAVFTGYFKDSERRIDLVLVIQDDGHAAADEVRVTFLINALKLGLQLEIEPGLMKQHKHLMFVKVHAPDTVIEEEGDNFRVHRLFKDTHVEFVNPGNRVIKFCKRLLPFFFNSHEKEWIKITRQRYPGAMNYSTLERSLIVYRMLLALPFGDHENYVGLNRLIKNNVILDAFALHDGPYFFIPKQNIPSHVNGRQILFANWVGGGNLLKFHPVSMIQEYLGDRIAFYFAFTEFYIIALTIPVVAGNIFIYYLVKDGLKFIQYRRWWFDEHCYGDYKLYFKRFDYWYLVPEGCPTCIDWAKCPFNRFQTLCTEFILKSMVTSSKLLYFYAILTLWAIMFVFLWKRRQHYFRWLWETDDKALSYTYRHEYQMQVKNLKRSKTTGMWIHHESMSTRATRVAFNLILLGLCACAVYFLTLFWANFQYDMVNMSPKMIRKVNVSLYYGIVKTTVLYSIMVTVLGKVTVLLSRLVVQYENHRHQESYDRSMIGKMCIFTLIITFWYLAFLAFVKGRFYTYPNDPKNIKSPGGINMMHCNFLGCVDQVAVTVVAFAFVKFVIPNGLFYLLPITTDYNQGTLTNAKIPIWEREYRMTPITEQDIREMFLELTVQFAFVVLFSGAFSPISLIILIANVWDVRYKARLLLVGRRRPLLFRCSGIGTWLTWWKAIAYVAVLSNAFMCAFNTRIITNYIYEFGKNKGSLELRDIFSDKFLLEQLRKAPPMKGHNQYVPENEIVSPDWVLSRFCRYPGKYKISKDEKSYEETIYIYYAKYYELLLVIVYELCFILIIMLLSALTHIFPAPPKDIEETLKAEKRIRTQFYIRRKRI